MALNIVFTWESSALAAPQSFRDGMQAAASILEGLITDDITLNILVGYGDWNNSADTGLTTAAEAAPLTRSYVSYSDLRTDLASHETSTYDQTFVDSLPTTSSVGGTSTFLVPSAVEKALGLLSPAASGLDGAVGMGTAIPSDLLVGVALHEITHAMGRFNSEGPFDLFRFTSPGNRLFGGGSTAVPAYFSIDGGTTNLADFGQSSDPSDFLNTGRQGATDPFNEFYSNSTLQSLTDVDQELLDVMGFNVDTSPPLIECVSIGFNGEANGASGTIGESSPLIFGADDRYVAFWSDASNLVPNDSNTLRDVFVYDRIAHTTKRIPAGIPEISGDYGALSVTADGTYLAYGDLIGSKIVVYNLATDTSEEVATGWVPGQDGAGAYISGDGRYVAFATHAALTADANGVDDIYVYDRDAQSFERMLAKGGGQPNGDSVPTSISGDGRFVAFYSSASNLVDDDTNGFLDTFIYDQVAHTIEKISIGIGGTQANGDSAFASITPDGRYVAFSSSASNLVSQNTTGRRNIFVYDRVNQTTELVSMASDGTPLNGFSDLPSISADGRFVTFHSNAATSGDTNGTWDVFVFDRKTHSLVRLSDAPGGTAGNAQSAMATISADGQYAAFLSDASNLVADDHNGATDVFLAHLKTNAPEPTKNTTEGSLLTASTTLRNPTYQWYNSPDGTNWSPIPGAIASTYVVAESDEKLRLQVAVAGTDSVGQPNMTATYYPFVVDVAPTLSVTVTGNAIDGSILTANTTLTTDGDDSAAGATHQWQRTFDGITWTAIPGAIGSTYQLGETDAGSQVAVAASFTDDTGLSANATSNLTGIVTETDSPPTLTVTMAGTAQEGQTLTATPTAQSDEALTIGYQWQSSSNGLTWTTIAGATSATYTLTEADENNSVRVEATTTDDTRQSVTADSNATGPIADTSPSLTVTLTGTAQEGQTLTATATSQSDEAPTISYQWERNGSPISDATSATYVVADADDGAQIEVVASFTDDTGQSVNATSNPTGVVVDAPPRLSVSISGTAQEGEALTAVAVANDGDASIKYQWEVRGIGTTWSKISGATSSTYVLTEANEGENLRVLATSTDSDVGSAAVISIPTAQVTDLPPTLSVLTTGAAQDGMTLTAIPSVTSDGDGGTLAFRWQKAFGTAWKNIAGATNATYSVAEIDEGHQLRVLATFKDDTGQSVSVIGAATAAVTDIAPQLTIVDNSLTLPKGGSVAMGVSVSVPDTDDAVSVRIVGIKAYESITDNLDHQTLRGGQVTFTAAQVNSGLTLNSTYGGTGHPVNTLTLTAFDTTGGETISSAPQTIVVTDPPATTSVQIALLAQYAASSFATSGAAHGAIPVTGPAAGAQPFLTQPQHA